MLLLPRGLSAVLGIHSKMLCLQLKDHRQHKATNELPKTVPASQAFPAHSQMGTFRERTRNEAPVHPAGCAAMGEVVQRCCSVLPGLRSA